MKIGLAVLVFVLGTLMSANGFSQSIGPDGRVLPAYSGHAPPPPVVTPPPPTLPAPTPAPAAAPHPAAAPVPAPPAAPATVTPPAPATIITPAVAPAPVTKVISVVRMVRRLTSSLQRPSALLAQWKVSVFALRWR